MRVRSSTIGKGMSGGQLGGCSSVCCFDVIDGLDVDGAVSFVFDFDLGGIVRCLYGIIIGAG